MAIIKPTKPDSELPKTWGGTQYPYTEEQIAEGLPEAIPTIIDGGTLNYEKKGVFERMEYVTQVSDAVAGAPIKKTLITNANNQFEYAGIGVYSYSATQTYALDDYVIYSTNEGTKIYKSLSNNNIGKELTNETYWEELSLGGGGGLEIGDIGFAPLGIDETKNKRRYLNGQVISQAQFVSFTNKIKSAIELYPNLATSETNWQAEVTNSKLGQCGKFVIDDALGTIRLPKVVNINGLQNLSLLGGIKAESLPNITGSVASSGGAWNGSVTQSGALYITSSGKEDSGGGGNNGVKYNFNASRSSSTYKDKAPVQQEAIQYPYFIQVATGVEESVDVTREIELNNPFFLGMSQYFESEPNNASWLISNGSFHSGATYVSFYEWLLKIYNGTETVDGVSVKASTDTYDDYDYVINTADTTFRLPIYDGSESLPSDKYINLTLDVSGSAYTAPANGYITLLKVAGAANKIIRMINTTSGYIVNSTMGYSTGSEIGVSVPCKKGDSVSVYYDVSGETKTFRFIYAKGKGSLYFYVGETIQDVNVINASGVLTRVAELNDSYISGLGMPSERYVNLTLGATGSSYTAPANGWFAISKKSGAVDQYVNLAGIETSIIAVAPLSGATASCYLPARKGDVVKCWWTASGTLSAFRFVYAEGEN